MANEMQELEQPTENDTPLDMESMVTGLGKEAVTKIVEELGTPEGEEIERLTAELTASIAEADTTRESFNDNFKKKQFLSRSTCSQAAQNTLGKLAISWKSSMKLLKYTRNLFTTHVKALDFQVVALNKKYDDLSYKNTSITPEMKVIRSNKQRIESLLEDYKTKRGPILDQINNFTKLLENKKDQRKVDLYKMEYYRKKEGKKMPLFVDTNVGKAESKAKNGTERTPVDSRSMIAAGPKHDKSKNCAVSKELAKTNQQRENNHKPKKGSSYTGIVEWTDKSDQTVPDIVPEIDKLVTNMNTLMKEIPELATMLKQVGG